MQSCLSEELGYATRECLMPPGQRSLALLNKSAGAYSASASQQKGVCISRVAVSLTAFVSCEVMP